MSRLLVGMLVAFALVVAGCGGGDDEGGGDGGSGGGGNAAAEWQTTVNGICTRNQQEIQRIAQEVASSGETDPQKAVAELLERSKEVEEGLLDELRDVEVPDDIQGDYDAFLDRIGDTIPLFDQLADVQAGGEEDPELTQELEAIAADTRPFAEENDLNACLTDGGGEAAGSTGPTGP